MQVKGRMGGSVLWYLHACLFVVFKSVIVYMVYMNFLTFHSIASLTLFLILVTYCCRIC